MEDKDRATYADWRTRVRMLVGAAFGFLTVVTVGVASADDTQSSNPDTPDVMLVPAVVVSAGADSLNTNAVAQLAAYGDQGTEFGTGVHVGNGSIATVAHALLDARGVSLGDPLEPTIATLTGDDAIPFVLNSATDLAVFRASTGLDSLSLATVEPVRGDLVVVAGFGRSQRLEVESGTVIYRGTGEPYGVDQADILVISASVDAGWSGGPVVNPNGELVAIIVGKEQTSGVTIAVPVAHLRPLLDSLG